MFYLLTRFSIYPQPILSLYMSHEIQTAGLDVVQEKLRWRNRKQWTADKITMMKWSKTSLLTEIRGNIASRNGWRSIGVAMITGVKHKLKVYGATILSNLLAPYPCYSRYCGGKKRTLNVTLTLMVWFHVQWNKITAAIKWIKHLFYFIAGPVSWNHPAIK